MYHIWQQASESEKHCSTHKLFSYLAIALDEGYPVLPVLDVQDFGLLHKLLFLCLYWSMKGNQERVFRTSSLCIRRCHTAKRTFS